LKIDISITDDGGKVTNYSFNSFLGVGFKETTGEEQNVPSTIIYGDMSLFSAIWAFLCLGTTIQQAAASSNLAQKDQDKEV